MNYSEALAYLESLQSTKIELGLARIMSACAILGNPEDKFRSVHVAGTNGKGSTCAFLESIFRHHGLKIGLFTSPHLSDVRERIQMDRQMIPENEFAKLADDVKEIYHCEPRLTYFEFLTAVGFQYFAEKMVDVAVVEVGLGGRFDSTNVVTPLVSVITRIGMDHQAYLGDTLGKIAFEKAGIIKEGVPVVTVDQATEAMEVIRRVADEKGSMLHVVRPYDVRYKLGLLGGHQQENAALALRAAEIASENSSLLALRSSSLAEAFLSTRWPGRLEVVSEKPLVILDGAHNPNGAESLAKFIKKELKDRHVVVMLGIMADKDIDGIIGPLAEVADEIVLTRPSGSRAADPSLVASRLSLATSNQQPATKTIEPLRSAIEQTLKTMPENSALIIAGSLYTVGEAREYFNRMSSSAFPSG